MASTVESTAADTSLLISSMYGAMVKPLESDQSATSSPPSTSSPFNLQTTRVKTNFVPCKPSFAPSGYGRMVLIYDSVSHPGHRREFAYKTQFTNMSGSTTVYYRCMACRALRHRLQRTMNPDELPAVPCIAVKNDQLMNDPDYPEANNHFCTPPTIEESMARQRNGYAKLMRKLRAQKGRDDPVGKGGVPPFEAVESANLLLQQIQSNLYTGSEEPAPAKTEMESDAEQNESMDANVSANARLEALVKMEEDRFQKLNGSLAASSVEENNNLADIVSVASSAVSATPNMGFGASALSNKVSELWRALSRPKGVSTHISEIIDKFIVNNWELPESFECYRNLAELTCTQILCLARQLPQAAAAVRDGKWDKNEFKGDEVFGKTLAIIGLGRIGLEVASRMTAFGMNVIGYDVMVGPEMAAKRGVRWTPLEQIWPQADYITLHVPLIPQTANMINREVLAKCKKGVKIINVARGGIVNEPDLVESLNAGHAGGAAFDVFEEEPPTYRELVDHPKSICTPHLGAGAESQKRVADEIAENIATLNKEAGQFGTLSAAAVATVLDEAKAEFVKTTIALSRIVASLTNNFRNVIVRYPAAATGLDKALVAGTVVGLLQAKGNAGLNLINAEMNAKKEGIQVTVEPSKTGELGIIVGTASVTGYPSPSGAIISSVNGSKVPVPVVATGTFVISAGHNAVPLEFSDSARAQLLAQYGLVGSGQLAIFDGLDSQEFSEISKRYSVIQF